MKDNEYEHNGIVKKENWIQIKTCEIIKKIGLENIKMCAIIVSAVNNAKSRQFGCGIYMLNHVTKNEIYDPIRGFLEFEKANGFINDTPSIINEVGYSIIEISRIEHGFSIIG